MAVLRNVRKENSIFLKVGTTSLSLGNYSDSWNNNAKRAASEEWGKKKSAKYQGKSKENKYVWRRRFLSKLISRMGGREKRKRRRSRNSLRNDLILTVGTTFRTNGKGGDVSYLAKVRTMQKRGKVVVGELRGSKSSQIKGKAKE